MRIFRTPKPTIGDILRLFDKFDRRGDDECWPWKNPGKRGYGQIRIGAFKFPAHRVVYEVLVGPVPNHLAVDHTCHNDTDCPGGDDCPHRACCNPAHLEPVTERVNILRGKTISAANARVTHCPKGHEYTTQNTTVTARGTRDCRTCNSDQAKARYLRDGEAMRARNRASYASRRKAMADAG